MNLRIQIRAIPSDHPKQHEGKLEASDFNRLAEELGTQVGDFSFSLEVSRKQDSIFIRGNLEGTLNLICDRCSESFPFAQKDAFDFVLLPASIQQEFETEVVLSMDDLDTGFYSGEWLELKDLLEEQILLGLPVRSLCSEMCKGRCTQCGNNLNIESCICPPKDLSDHPFVALAKK